MLSMRGGGASKGQSPLLVEHVAWSWLPSEVGEARNELKPRFCLPCSFSHCCIHCRLCIVRCSLTHPLCGCSCRWLWPNKGVARPPPWSLNHHCLCTLQRPHTLECLVAVEAAESEGVRDRPNMNSGLAFPFLAHPLPSLHTPRSIGLRMPAGISS